MNAAIGLLNLKIFEEERDIRRALRAKYDKIIDRLPPGGGLPIAEKLLAGRDGEINRCGECLACFAAIRKGPIRCSVNAAV